MGDIEYFHMEVDIMEITIKNITVAELKELLGIQDKPKIRETHEPSPYAVFFDETSAAWTKNPECNKLFLLRTQDLANLKLKTRGYLFLNEVFDMLGVPRCKTGQLVGWVYDEVNPVGDNYVDFGIFNECNHKFVNGFEKSVLLDFNVDGNILDRL